MGFPGGTSSKESACQCRWHKRHRFDTWVGTIPWSRKWQLTPLFLSGKFHRERSLVSYSQNTDSEGRHDKNTYFWNLKKNNKLEKNEWTKFSLRNENESKIFRKFLLLIILKCEKYIYSTCFTIIYTIKRYLYFTTISSVTGIVLRT